MEMQCKWEINMNQGKMASALSGVHKGGEAAK
jgi:hypothetical protein